VLLEEGDKRQVIERDDGGVDVLVKIENASKSGAINVRRRTPSYHPFSEYRTS
jgi:hypothetical protein